MANQATEIPADVLMRAAEAIQSLPRIQTSNEDLARATLEAAGWAEQELAVAQPECEQFRVAASQLKWLGELPADERDRLIKMYFGDFAKVEAERDEARAALAFVMPSIDGFAGVSPDRYEAAMTIAVERGHEEPTVEDELDGFLRLITMARQTLGEEDKA